MREKQLLVGLLICSFILNGWLLWENRKINKYEQYLTEEMQKSFRVLDKTLVQAYNLLDNLEKGDTISTQELNQTLLTSLHYILFDIQDLDQLIYFDWFKYQRNMINVEFSSKKFRSLLRSFSADLDPFDSKFKSKSNPLNITVKTTMTINDLDKEAIKEYKTLLKQYINYKTENFNTSGSEFTEKFHIKDDSWIAHYNEITKIFFQEE